MESHRAILRNHGANSKKNFRRRRDFFIGPVNQSRWMRSHPQSSSTCPGAHDRFRGDGPVRKSTRIGTHGMPAVRPESFRPPLRNPSGSDENPVICSRRMASRSGVGQGDARRCASCFWNKRHRRFSESCDDVARSSEKSLQIFENHSTLIRFGWRLDVFLQQ